MKQIKQTKVLISLKKSKCVHCCFFIALKHWPFYLTRDKWTFTYSFTCPSVHVCVPFPSLTKHTSINLPTHPPPHTHPPFYTLTHLSTHCSVTPHCCLWVREASSLASPIEQGDLQAARGVGAVTKDQVDPPLIVFHSQDFCGDVQLHSQFQNSNSNQGPARKEENNPTGTQPFPAFQGGGFLLDRGARLILPYLFHGCFHLPRRRKQDSERSNYMAKFAPQKGKCAKLGDPGICSFSEPSSSPFVSHPLSHPLETYSRVHFECQAQRDGDVETMAVRALHKAKFQQLGVSDFYAVQGQH